MTSYRPSFLALIVTLFITPLFFIPGGALDLGNAKSFVAVLGIGVAAVLFLVEFIRSKHVDMPRHHLLSVALILPIVYLLSALLTTPSSLSLLGYNLEVGTFGSILLGVAALFLATVALADTQRVLQALLVLFGSFGILATFVAIKVLAGGDILVLGNFAGSMGNPLGSWMDLGVAFGLLATLSMLALAMLPMRGAFKFWLWVAFALSTLLLAVVHFVPALLLAFVASVSAFFYFSKIENGYSEEARGARVAPILLGIVSLVLLVNPLVGGERRIGEVVSGTVGVTNSEIRPTLSTTLSISKAVLVGRSLLGSGPNTFAHDWLSYKPSDINTTPYWAIAFPFGAGFMATQVATTGVIGSILWIAFFVLLIALTLKSFSHIPESRASRFALVSTLAVTYFLWAAFFFYTPALPVLVIACIFTGILLALSREIGFVPTKSFRFPAAPLKQVAVLVGVLCLGGIVYLGWTELERTLAAFHFQRAADLSNTSGASVASIEEELLTAVKFAPLDVYYLALSQLNLSKAQVIANSATGTPEQNQAAFEESLGRSIQAVRSAVTANPASYDNWVALGNTYSLLVPEPLKLEGSYESAQYAYNEAFKRNPSNPQLPLLLAQLELNKGDVDLARSYIRSSLALKSDYADAYILLARLESAAKNTAAAIASAEQVATLLPDNVGVQFELGLLKYSSGDYAGARTALETALKLSPDYANAKYYLALSLANLGERDAALTKLEELKVSNPDSAELDAAIKSLSTPATR